jgi:hypothetical protein
MGFAVCAVCTFHARIIDCHFINSMASCHQGFIPTERSLFIGKVSARFFQRTGVAWLVLRIPTAVFLDFPLDWSFYFFFLVAPQLYSRV